MGSVAVTGSVAYDTIMVFNGHFAEHILPDQAHICTYLPACPAAWQPTMVHMVLAGTAHIPSYNWGQPGYAPQSYYPSASYGYGYASAVPSYWYGY